MSATSGSDYVVELAFGLVFGLILSWSVGLAPALVYRYAIFRRPIEEDEVFWRLAPIIVILMFAFKLTMGELSGKPPSGNPVPWIIIYYIGKWIMTRRPLEKSLNLTTGEPSHATERSGEAATATEKDGTITAGATQKAAMKRHFRCPTCQTKLRIGDEKLGRTVRCPKCSQRIKAPEAEFWIEEEPPPPPMGDLPTGNRPTGNRPTYKSTFVPARELSTVRERRLRRRRRRVFVLLFVLAALCFPFPLNALVGPLRVGYRSPVYHHLKTATLGHLEVKTGPQFHMSLEGDGDAAGGGFTLLQVGVIEGRWFLWVFGQRFVGDDIVDD